jgi:archaellum component FlaC
MSSIPFNVPSLVKAKAWVDMRGTYPGGYGWRGDRPLTSVIKVVMHHSVTNPQKSLVKEANLVKQIHVDGNKWGGIGYHFIISTEEVNGYAKVGYVGDIGSIRAHAPDMKGKYSKAGSGNYYYIGICMIGMLHQVMPTDAQIRSAHELVNELIYAEDKRLPKLKTWNDMIPHKETDSTSCPGMWEKYRDKIISNINNAQEMEEINKLKAELTTMTSDRDNWKNKVGVLQTQVDTLTTQNGQLTNEVNGLKEELKKFDGVEKKLQELDSLTNKVNALLKAFDVQDIKDVKAKYEEAQAIKESGAYKVASFFLAIIPGIRPKK